MNVFVSRSSVLLAISILSVSIQFLNLLHAANLLLFVVVNPFLYPLLDPARLGSDINVPGKFSSPISLITTNAASPSVLFSTLQYISASGAPDCISVSIPRNILICSCTGVLLCIHSPTCRIPGSSYICIALLSPPVPKLGSNPAI